MPGTDELQECSCDLLHAFIAFLFFPGRSFTCPRGVRRCTMKPQDVTTTPIRLALRCFRNPKRYCTVHAVRENSLEALYTWQILIPRWPSLCRAEGVYPKVRFTKNIQSFMYKILLYNPDVSCTGRAVHRPPSQVL